LRVAAKDDAAAITGKGEISPDTSVLTPSTYRFLRPPGPGARFPFRADYMGHPDDLAGK
jgi:hypothetical protein